MKPSPTDLGTVLVVARPEDHRALGDGATRDPDAIRAFVDATTARRVASAKAALVPGQRRGYTREENERARVLLDEAASLRRIAAAKQDPYQQRFVLMEAEGLERLADEIVPREHRR